MNYNTSLDEMTVLLISFSKEQKESSLITGWTDHYEKPIAELSRFVIQHIEVDYRAFNSIAKKLPSYELMCRVVYHNGSGKIDFDDGVIMQCSMIEILFYHDKEKDTYTAYVEALAPSGPTIGDIINSNSNIFIFHKNLQFLELGTPNNYTSKANFEYLNCTVNFWAYVNWNDINYSLCNFRSEYDRTR